MRTPFWRRLAIQVLLLQTEKPLFTTGYLGSNENLESVFSADISQRSRNLNNGNCDLITVKLCDMTAHSSDPVPWSDLE
jgi:hypothetical protein